MAAVMNVTKRTLSISILRGQNADGNPVSKSYVYSNVKPDVEPDKLMVVGKALGGLFDNERLRRPSGTAFACNPNASGVSRVALLCVKECRAVCKNLP